VKNDYGNEQEARALNGLEEPLKKILFGLFFDTEYGGDMFLRNVG
jgi:hypothetical protein